jgi:Flp pilus assembly protein TadD
MPTAPKPSQFRRGMRLYIALPILVLAACADHPDSGNQGTQAGAGKDVSAKVAVDIAERERAAGDPTGALTFYRRALAIDPNQPKIPMALGQTLLEAGQPNEAAEIFRKLLAKPPNDPEALTGLGMALVQLGQANAAVEPLRKGLVLAPDARGYRALGVAENLMGQNAAAEADYNRGLALAPNDPGLRNNLGLSLALSGNFDGAIAILRAAATGPAATAKTRQNLALALGLAGRTTDAEQVARMDLDEQSVQSNIAYYATLRALSPKERTEALLRPATQPPARAPVAQ